MRTRRRRAMGTAVVLTAAMLTGVTPGRADAAPMSTSARVVIGDAPVLPPGAQVTGTVSDQAPVHLIVTLAPKDPVGLRQAVTAVSDPGSPRYRQFLSPTQFATSFGASDATIDAARRGLESIGMKPGPVAANRLSIQVDATAGQVASGFHTSLRSFTTAEGRKGFANSARPTLPVALASSVQGVLGLDTLPVAKPLGTEGRVEKSATSPRRAAQLAGAVPVACADALDAANSYGGANPADLLNAYSASSLVANGSRGGGQNVAVLSLQTLDTQDVSVYRQCFSTTGQVISHLVDGGAVLRDGTDEATLDVETIMGLAPDANIHFYESPNTDTGWYDNMATIVGDDLANAVSVSWGECEPDVVGVAGPNGNGHLIDAEFNLLAQAALQGQTFFVSSGDSGSAACEPGGNTSLAVNDPASQPFVTAVGGTTLSTTTAPPVESVWNNASGSSGGGVSSYWLQPDYQSGITDSADSACGSAGTYCRSVPDVAASADPDTHGLIIYSGGTWVPFGGTSVAAPQWAALTADMNSSCPNTKGFGMLNYALYQLPASAFNDVTVGDNDFAGTNNGKFAAKTGYDLATGLGTPKISAMVGALCAHTPTLSANESFVLAAYVDFTGSLPLDDSSDPIDYWVTQLGNGTPRSTLVSALANSNAWVSNIVTRFYRDTLGRAPDAGGLAYWEQIIESGTMSVAQAAAQFYSSDEYFRTHGNSAASWVDDLYSKLLQRAPDSGATYWVSQVATRGRAWVALAFYQSSESRRTRVNNLYLQLLHRQADPAGLAYWTPVIATAGDISLAVNLASSSEYYNLAAKRFPGP